MPVFNAEKYLALAIESILKQSFQDFELIIIDDGSTDNSRKIIEQYTQSDARIAFIQQKNSGISVTRNKLVSLANAEIIAWMDADDISHPSRLRDQYDFLQQNKEFVAIGTSTIMIDKDGDEIFEWKMPLEHEQIDNLHLAGKGGAIIFPSSMMKKEAVLNAGGFDEKLTGAEDLCLFLRLAEMGKLANLEQYLFFYRQHIDSICHSNRSDISSDRLSVLTECGIRRGIKLSITEAMTNSPNNLSPYEIYIKWGWWALKGKNIQTSRKYAFKAFKHSPISKESLKLLYCAVRGY